MTAHDSHEFTPAECAAVACAADGMPNKVIAECTGFSMTRVGSLLARARAKAGVTKTAQLVGIVVRRGLV